MIHQFATYIVFKLLGLSENAGYAKALHFFIYDTIKILFLLAIIIFLMGVINSYIPVERIRMFLNKRRFYGIGNFLASLFGAITPFCSCSSIPLFIGFLKGGIPLGITLSFLITSPLVNEVALAVLWGVFGMKVTIAYALSGIFIGTFIGIILGKFKLERYVEDWVKKQIEKKISTSIDLEKKTIKTRLPEIFNEAKETLLRVLPYVIIGIAIGAIIHGYVPTGYFEKYITKENMFAVPIATLLAVPMYTNATGIIPIIQSLIDKGIPLGTALAFMMGVVGLSLPEALLLKKVMKIKLIFIYFGTVSVAIMIIGYFLNFLF